MPPVASRRRARPRAATRHGAPLAVRTEDEPAHACVVEDKKVSPPSSRFLVAVTFSHCSNPLRTFKPRTLLANSRWLTCRKYVSSDPSSDSRRLAARGAADAFRATRAPPALPPANAHRPAFIILGLGRCISSCKCEMKSELPMNQYQRHSVHTCNVRPVGTGGPVPAPAPVPAPVPRCRYRWDVASEMR